MFANAKKILITTESHEVFIIRPIGETAVGGFCPECGEQVEMLHFDAVTSLSGIGGRELIRCLKDGTLHSIESDTGHLLICKRSLSGQTRDLETKTILNEEFGGKLWD